MSETGPVDKWLLLGRRMWRWRKALMQPFRWIMFWWKTCWLGARVKGVGREHFFLVAWSKGNLITFIAQILEMSFDMSIFGPNLHLSRCDELRSYLPSPKLERALAAQRQSGNFHVCLGGKMCAGVVSNMIYVWGDDLIKIFQLGSNQQLLVGCSWGSFLHLLYRSKNTRCVSQAPLAATCRRDAAKHVYDASVVSPCFITISYGNIWKYMEIMKIFEDLVSVLTFFSTVVKLWCSWTSQHLTVPGASRSQHQHEETFWWWGCKRALSLAPGIFGFCILQVWKFEKICFGRFITCVAFHINV